MCIVGTTRHYPINGRATLPLVTADTFNSNLQMDVDKVQFCLKILFFAVKVTKGGLLLQGLELVPTRTLISTKHRDTHTHTHPAIRIDVHQSLLLSRQSRLGSTRKTTFHVHGAAQLRSITPSGISSILFGFSTVHHVAVFTDPKTSSTCLLSAACQPRQKRKKL